MDCNILGFPVHHQLPDLLKLMSIESVMPSNHLIICCLHLILLSIFFSIRVFFNESVYCVRWPKYWSFIISPSDEYSGLTYFRIDWFDLFHVQGILESPLERSCHSSEASILWCSTLLMVQLSHPYMTTEKTIALNIQTFFGKVMSLLFNRLSRLVITFLPRSKSLLISCLESPSTVILSPQK